MSFENAAATTSPVTSINSKTEKPAGYLNIGIRDDAGNPVRIGGGGLQLKLSNATEAKLVEFLEADPKNIEVLMANLVIDYKSSTPVAKEISFLG